MDTKQKTWWLYILKLEQGKWYVGITSQTPEKRFDQHLRGVWAAEWTRLYKPLEMYSSEKLGTISKESAESIEHQRTRELMRKYGWKNVRGGRFCSLEYKKHFGILWRVNTENDIPSMDTLYSIVAASWIVVLSTYILLKLYVL